MPFTPYHWGPSSCIGLALFRLLDFPTLMIASVIIDIEPFLIFIFNIPGPLHGFLHNFLGVFNNSNFYCNNLLLFEKQIKKVMNFFKLSQDSSFKKILSTSFFSVYLHLLLDAFLYEEMNIFYPFKGNPFFGLFSFQQVYLFCNLSFLIGILLYLTKLYLIRRENFK